MSSTTPFVLLLLFFIFTRIVISTQELCSTATWNENGVRIDGTVKSSEGDIEIIADTMAFDSDDNLYIANVEAKRISKISKSTGKITQMAPKYLFNLFIDKYNTLYVSTFYKLPISKKESNSTNDVWTKAISNYTLQNSDGIPTEIEDIYVDNEGAIYVLDLNDCCVLKYPLGNKGGIIIAGGNECGSAANQLDGPSGIYVDVTDKNTLYIADSRNHRIQKWRAGAKEGVTVAGGNGDGSELNQLNGPNSLLVDPITKAIYVADGDNNRIVRWLQNDTQGQIILKKNLHYPRRILFDADKNLYVRDSDNQYTSRLYKFSFNKSSCSKQNGKN